MMEVISGMLDGFVQRSGQLRAENEARAKADEEMEQKILLELANKSDDDEVRSMAVMGLLSGGQARKKKGGLKGWLGEMQEHPAMGQIRSLLGTPKRVETPAARPAQALTQGGMPGAYPQPPGGAEHESDAGIPGTDENIGWDPSLAPPSMAGKPGTPAPPTVSYEKRQAFLSPAGRIEADARANISGRLRGLVGAGNEFGADFSPGEVADIARGLAGAPRRQSVGKLVNVQLQDGQVVVGRYDATTNELLNENDDTPITNAARILGTTNGSAGMTTRVVPSRQSPTGWMRERVGNDGVVTWQAPAAPPSQPFPYGTTVATPGGIYGQTRGGQMELIPGSPGASVDPQTYYQTVVQTGNQIEQEANAAVRSLGQMGRNPARVAEARDQIAKKYGFAGGWADYQAALTEAGRGVQTAAQPPQARPPAGATPPAAPAGQSMDVNKVLEELKRRRGGTAAPTR